MKRVLNIIVVASFIVTGLSLQAQDSSRREGMKNAIGSLIDELGIAEELDNYSFDGRSWQEGLNIAEAVLTGNIKTVLRQNGIAVPSWVPNVPVCEIPAIVADLGGFANVASVFGYDPSQTGIGSISQMCEMYFPYVDYEVAYWESLEGENISLSSRDAAVRYTPMIAVGLVELFKLDKDTMRTRSCAYQKFFRVASHKDCTRLVNKLIENPLLGKGFCAKTKEFAKALLPSLRGMRPPRNLNGRKMVEFADELFLQNEEATQKWLDKAVFGTLDSLIKKRRFDICESR